MNEMHKMTDFELYKLAKHIVNYQESYTVNKIFSEIADGKLMLKGFVCDECRPVEVVAYPTRRTTVASDGFFSEGPSPAGIKMLVAECDEIESNFLEDTQIIGLFLGSSVCKIQGDSLLHRLRFVYVNSQNQHFFAENDVLFNKDQSKLILYAPLKPESEYRVPLQTKILGYSAFALAENLQKLYIPKGTVNLGYIPPSVEVISY